MQFGERVRELRRRNQLSQKTLAEMVGVTDAYLSKVENQRLDFGEYPSENLIHKLADALDDNEEELLILAEKIPEYIRKRFMERPDAFRALALADDETLDRLVEQLLTDKTKLSG